MIWMISYSTLLLFIPLFYIGMIPQSISFCSRLLRPYCRRAIYTETRLPNDVITHKFESSRYINMFCPHNHRAFAFCTSIDGDNYLSRHEKQTKSFLSNNKKAENRIDSGVRINKCLPTLSRRAADAAVEEGRVTVNSNIATVGTRVHPGDVVILDGKTQNWKSIVEAKNVKIEKNIEERNFLYLKYWKPSGVTCTSDLRDRTNIITAGKFDLFPQRLFTVGRLDKESTGLIILTSDGRVNNAILNPATKKEKIYEVELNDVPTDQQLVQLRSGVLITTTIQRDSYSKPVTAKTLPCSVDRIQGSQSRWLRFTLTEGRNRQIRRMAEAIGLKVINLHRTSFAGISLKGLTEGNWMELNTKEIKIIQNAVENLSVKGVSRAIYDIEED